VADGIGRLIAFFRRSEPRGAAPSGWGLAFDAAVAVGASIGAVYQAARHAVMHTIVLPGVPGGLLVPGGHVRPVGWLGRALFASPVPGHVSFAVLAATALTALPLAARRLYPISVWLVIAAALLATHSLYVPPAIALGTAIYAAYSAIACSRYRNLAIAAVATVTVFASAMLGNDLPHFPGRLTAIFAILPAAAAGLGIRQLRRRLADSHNRLRRATAEAQAATERALATERARIAPELHDVVTHNVSVMLIQAGAARKVLASSPGAAEHALLAVEATGREAMSELRNLLGLLSPPGSGDARRASDREVSGAAAGRGIAERTELAAGSARPAASGGIAAPLAPQPGLGELSALIGRVTAAGLPVELEVSGEPRPLPPGADLAAYRVVQEGLTNVLRHAGQATASIGVHWGEDLEVTVSDDGASPGGGIPGGNGAHVTGDPDGSHAARGLLVCPN
jgi:signal transduction histidine kinase